MNKIFLKNIKKAFSIIELLLVVAIVLLLFSVSISKMSFVNRFLVENEVDKLFTVFSFLQQRAIASNQEQELIFDLTQNAYFYNLGSNSNSSKEDLKSVQNLAFCKLPEAVKFGYLEGASGPPSSPSQKITNSITFKNIMPEKFKVTFFVYGKIQAGTVYFVDKNRNFMMALTCPISQVSFIRKYKYNQGKWTCFK